MKIGSDVKKIYTPNGYVRRAVFQGELSSQASQKKGSSNPTETDLNLRG